jgi:cell division protein FtsW (lipid II flippase)
MNLLLRKLIGMNWLLLAVAVGLSIFGVMAIYSATYMRAEVYLTEMWRRQIIWLGIGIVIFFVAALVDFSSLLISLEERPSGRAVGWRLDRSAFSPPNWP